jgi:flagellar biosynthesis protein FliR
MTADQMLQTFGITNVVGFFLVLARISPLFVMAPMFSSRMVPPRVRTVVAVGLAIGLYPLALAGQHVPNEAGAIIGLILKELLVGLAFATTIAILVAAIETAGGILDFMVGFAFGGSLDPITGNQSAVLSRLYSLVAVAVFVAINGDAWLIQGLSRTFDLVPLTASPDFASISEGVVAVFTTIFTSAVEVAAPVLIACVLTDVAFGVVSRVVPQLNVFAVGFPVKVIVGLVVVAASLPFVAGWLDDELTRSVSQALNVVGMG